MNHTLPTVALLVLLALPAGCGHQAPVREGGRVTLVEDSPPSERFVIERATIESALEQGAGAFIRQLSLRPVATADGLFYGFQLLSVFPDRDPSADLPIRAGDIVQQVNGRSIERPEQFMAVWQSLATASHLSIRIVRDHKPFLVTWAIRDTLPAVSAVSPSRVD